MSSSVEPRLIRNPWSKSLGDNVVLGFLESAALTMGDEFDRLVDSGEAEEGRDSFAAVILDPTAPRSTRLRDMVIAIVLIGPNAANYVANGAAKADAHERHDVPMDELVQLYPHCLGDDDFAYGNSVEYGFAFGGGSGLSEEQDGDLVSILLREFIDRINEARFQWLNDRRANGGKRRWWNEADEPGMDYKGLIDLPYLAPVNA